MTIDFGTPVPVAELPPKATGGRKASATPAIEAWLKQIAPGAFYELPSKDPDDGHNLGRVGAVRKLAGVAYVVETRPVVPGKRYRIFVKVAETAGDAPSDAAADGKPAKPPK